MTEYNAIGHVNVSPTPRRTDAWLDALADYHPAIGHNDNGTTEIVITLNANVLEAAAAEALAVLLRAVGQLESFEIMTTAEYDRRTDAIDDPDYLGSTDAARLLGVSRQRMQQLAEDGTLPVIRIGERMLAFPRAAVEAYAAERNAG